MPQGAKTAYSPKQKRKAEHIEAGYRKRGTGAGRAKAIAWKTVNKQDHGAARKRTK